MGRRRHKSRAPVLYLRHRQERHSDARSFAQLRLRTSRGPLRAMVMEATEFLANINQLWRELLNRTSRGGAAVYLAHMIVRQLDFSMRVHDRATVDYSLPIVREIITDISTL